MKMTINMETIPCLQNNHEILIVGDPDSKRTGYFFKAAEGLRIPVRCIDWKQVREQKLAPSLFVKIDPPASMGVKVRDLDEFVSWYQGELQYLQSIEGLVFLNEPEAILESLDKIKCKQRLEQCGIPSTAMISAAPSCYEQLRSLMKEKCINSLFIKPRFGSGAAGIMAYRIHPCRQEEVIYTSMVLTEDGTLFNTKKLQRITDGHIIAGMADSLLKLPVILEKWEHKARFGEVTFDIRAVWQFGRLEHLVARGSKGPVTNLHLNNGAIPIEQIGLTAAQRKELVDLCQRTAACFPGLSSAGIDILMTPAGRFKVIEVNGQGDLIYQDIYGENRIYRRQIQEGISRYGHNT